MILVKALLKYVNNLCLDVWNKMKAGTHTDQDIENLISSIYLTALETKYFNLYKRGCVTIPDKNVVLFFKIFKAMGPPHLRKVFFCYAKLAAFCESETSLNLFYFFLREYLKNDRRIPTEIKFSSSPLNLPFYEDFITDHCRAESDFGQIILIMKSLVNGPVSKVAAEFMSESINLDFIMDLILDQNFMHKLTNLMIETGCMSEFLEKMLAKRPKENVKRICHEMAKFQEFHKVIKLLIEEDDSVETCLDIIDEGTDLDVGFVTKYFVINRELFERAIFALHNRIMIMIESLKTEFDCEVLFSAFEAFFIFPITNFPTLNGSDYTELYDLFLDNHKYNEDDWDAFSDLSLWIPAALPYVKFTRETITKYYNVLLLDTEEVETDFLTFIQQAIKYRYRDEESFMQVVEICFEFAEEHQFDFASITPMIMERLLDLNNFTLASKLLSFLKANNMVSKSVSLLTQVSIRLYG